jgi:hypothetical protein
MRDAQNKKSTEHETRAHFLEQDFFFLTKNNDLLEEVFFRMMEIDICG